MKVKVVSAGELGREQIERWAEIQLSVPALASPYFCPEFVQLTAATREDVMVAILEEAGDVMGFFPFQRDRTGIGRPVAGLMSDFQGVVIPESAAWDAAALVRASGLSAWRFDHLLAAQVPLRRFHWAEAPSPFMDLSAGFEGYRRQRRQEGSREIEQILYKARKAERRAGPLRFEFYCGDEAAFQILLRWKARQYRSTGQPDLTINPWVVRFLDRVRQQRGDRFAGVLSALYLGDRLAAVHLGMRSASVLHYWLPAYDPELAAFSPGQLCVVELARAAAAEGLQRIDLGKGGEPYKMRLMSGAIPVAEGAVDLRPVAAMAARSWFHAREWLRHSPLRRPLLGPARWLRRTLAARGRG